MRVEIEGLTEIKKNLAVFGVKIDKAIEKSLIAAAEKVINLSSAKVPVKTGKLRGSVDFRVDGDEVHIDYSAPYAVDVHERTEKGHSSGESKFLEKALNEYSGEFQDEFAKTLSKLLG